MRDKRGLRAVSSEGNIEWIFTAKSKISSWNTNIDLDGNVYDVDNSNTLCCIYVKGELVWELNDTRIYPSAETSFSPDVKYLYLNGNKTSIICVSILTHEIVREFSEFSSHGAPLVDTQGNVYVTGGYMYDIGL
ncbi:MAG: hypothetical protein KKB34_06475 [Bacteroidetes bacterium]|nr:hypothetical protein [Bacteroidota bacterium]